MAKLKISCVFLVASCFVSFAIASTETVNRWEERQHVDRDFSQHAPSDNFRGFYNETSSFDVLRKRRLYEVRAQDIINRITGYISVGDLALSFNLPFFGFRFSYIWIHLDGYLSFSRGLKENKLPIQFPVKYLDETVENDPSIIAPWFIRQDIPSKHLPESGVYARLVNIEKESDDMLRERLKQDFREGMIGAGDFTPSYALIVTWRNVTFVGGQEIKAEKLKTNTYQVVLATDEIRTYAMFNYDNIEWLRHGDHGDPYDETTGANPFVGFNGGNRTRAFELRPFSQSNRIGLIQKGGHGNGIEGRWFFQINEEVWPGSCVDKELDPNWVDRGRLTFFPRYGNMLGGTMVNITGPCLGTKNSRPESVNVRCKFDVFEVEGVFRDINHATCFQPFIAFHGYVDLAVSVNNNPYNFVGKYYIQASELARKEITIRNNKEREENPSSLTLIWRKEHLSWRGEVKGSLYLWGYREKVGHYPSLTFIDVLVENAFYIGKEVYELDVLQFRDRINRGKTDITFGFISMNFTEPAMGRSVKQSPTIWSRPMPLAWYFRPQWEREHKHGWKKHFCENWFENEKNSKRFATNIPRCPCTNEQANIDRGRFAPDTECNVIEKSCETFHEGAVHCVQSGRPSVDGASQLCCYDTYGELIRTGDTMYGGRPSRSFKHGRYPYKLEMMLPTLSHWLYDVMPFFHCCRWTEKKDSAETCIMYKFWRTSQDCSVYQSPGVASVYGDPHFHTFDGYNYTFNGRGEFVLVQADSEAQKLDIHGRFEHILSPIGMPRINGTKLAAIAARDNLSSVVEFRLRPDAARWKYHLFVLVDKEYVFFWDDSLRVQTFKGVTLYQSSGTWNMSHIVAMFDSGAGVEVKNNDGNLLVHIYLPLTYINKTSGLLGNWSRDLSDEFTLPDGRIILRPPASDQDIHNQFGMRWRLGESKQNNVQASLFHHDPIPFAEYDDPNFTPEFRYGQEIRIPENFTHKSKIDSTCSQSAACIYDLVVTGDVKFADKTRENEAAAKTLEVAARKREIRCPELPKPLNGKKSEIRYQPGTIVRFTCDEGYRLVGHDVRKCRDNGLWTWGLEATCLLNRCPPLPRPKNGRKSSNQYSPGNVVKFRCNKGYTLVGESVIRCEQNGTWTGLSPSCTPSEP